MNAKLTPRESFVLYGVFIALGYGLFVLGLYWGNGQAAGLTQEITTQPIVSAVRPVPTTTTTEIQPQGRLEVSAGSMDAADSKQTEVSAPPTQAAKPIAIEVRPADPSRALPASPASQPPAAAPASVSKTAAAPTSVKGAFTIQVGALKTEEEARKVMSRLQFRGYTGILDRPTSRKDPYFRVRVGNYATREAAERAEVLLKEVGFLTFVKKMN